MSRNDSYDALAKVILGLLFAIVVGLLVHYWSRGRDWFLYIGDDPDLYALTEAEYALFRLSAWAFTVETALVAAAVGSLAISSPAGAILGVSTFAGLVLLTGSLRSSEERAVPDEWDEDEHYYDLDDACDSDFEE